jgi:UDP-N-acetylglucosamine 2-epimerase (non-hydrolysing)
VHTGQHYDPELNSQFFEALEIPDPDINLEVGSGSHAVQTAEIMRRFEPILDRERPAAVLAVGDVNSTIACALVAAKKGVAVIHVEAGLRSFDRTMPEEINRVLTDQISELLFTTEQGARDNLLREGILASRIHFVGNVMIDTLRHNLEKAVPYTRTLGEHGAPAHWAQGGFAVLTLHRPSNVDDARTLRTILEAIREVAERVPVAFAVHPRTRARTDQHQLGSLLDTASILCLPPIGYLEMLGLIKAARSC